MSSDKKIDNQPLNPLKYALIGAGVAGAFGFLAGGAYSLSELGTGHRGRRFMIAGANLAPEITVIDTLFDKGKIKDNYKRLFSKGVNLAEDGDGRLTNSLSAQRKLVKQDVAFGAVSGVIIGAIAGYMLAKKYNKQHGAGYKRHESRSASWQEEVSDQKKTSTISQEHGR